MTELYERLHLEFREELERAKHLVVWTLFPQGMPAVYTLKKATKICEDEQDYQSRKILAKLSGEIEG